MLKKIVGILIICLLLIAPIWAAEGIIATPADFRYTLQRGEDQTGTITIINTCNMPLIVEIIPKKLHIWDNHLDYKDTGIATWITTQPDIFLLNAYEKHTITFKLTIPADLDYNDILGAILIHSKPNITSSNIFMDLVIPIHINVPGPIVESITLTRHDVGSWALSGMKIPISSTLENNGTITSNLTTTTKIKGLTGEYNIVGNGNIYPKEEISLKTIWHSNLWDFGFFTIDTTICYNNFGEDKNLTFYDQIFIIPWWILLLLTIIAYMIYQKK